MDTFESTKCTTSGTLIAAAILIACAATSRPTNAGEVNEDIRGGHNNLFVCKHGCRFERVQRAVNAARSGDTIHIGPGTYSENIVIYTENLTLVGTSAYRTTIDGGFRGSVFKLNPEVQSVSLSSMTITHGKGVTGGGIEVNNAVLKLKDSIVVANVATGQGGGIGILNIETPVEIERCVIANNYALEGGGLFVDPESAVAITDSAITHNNAEAGGGAFFSYASRTTMARTTISGNTSEGHGGGIWMASRGIGEPPPTVMLDHTAVVNNTATLDGGGTYGCLGSATCLILSGGSVIALNTPGP